MSNFSKSEKRILYTVLFIVTALLIAIVVELYIVYQQLLVSKLLLNANVIQQATKPETEKPINFWDLAALLVGVKIIGSKILSDSLSKIKEFAINYFNSLPKKLTLINLPVFLRIPGSKFPGKGLIATKEIETSEQAKLLFEYFKIAKDNGIFSGDQGALGYLQQFKSDVYFAKELYLKLVHDVFVKLHPDREQDAQHVFKFWEKVLVGSGDSNVLFVIQSTYLSLLDKLDETQYIQCFDVCFEKLVANKGIDPNLGIKREVTMFIRACELLTRSEEIKTKFNELYSGRENEDKDQLKPIFKSIFIAIINRKRI
jgi:hypothetical protein